MLAESTENDGAPASGSGRRRVRAEQRVVALTALMAFAAIGLVAAIPDFGVAERSSGPWFLAALVVLFGLSEWTVFHLELRREAISFSLSEVPLALALVFVAPGPGILARLVGGLFVLLWVRRPPFQKVLFNTVVFVLEVALAYLLFRSLVAAWGPTDSTLVLAAAVAVFVPSVVASVLVSVAISFFEGSLRQQVLSDLRLAGWLFIVNSAVAGVVVGLALVAPQLVVFALAPIALLWFVLKRHGMLDQRLRDLDALHGFAARVGRTLDPELIGQAGISEITELLRAEHGALVLLGDQQTLMTDDFFESRVRLPVSDDDPAWSALIAEVDGATLVSPERAIDQQIADRRLDSSVLVAPLRDGSGLLGIVVVAGRSGVFRSFSDDDVARLANLTEQLAASLRKGMLHQRIEREARRDGLTDLPNRASFERSLTAAAEQASDDEVLFVMMLDLDRFKEVNDTLGHHAGDDLLMEVGRRLSARLGEFDVVARLAGDEFAILGSRATSDEMIELAEACVDDVGRPVTLDGLEIVVTASAGLAVLEPGEFETSTLLRHADIAMYNAKSQRLGVEVYRDEIDRRTPARLSMLGDLRAAIEGRDLDVHFQPKLDLATGAIVGAEALVRWTHSVRGMVPPTQFVRVAEDTGLIKQLTDLMLGRGIATLRDIHDRGYHLGLAVNLSTHDLLDTKLAERVDQHLLANKVDPSLLTLEITESSLLIDAPRARSTINELNEVGVHMSIDDFGTGYSSLSYLRRLPVSELKIDRSFVANLLLDDQDEVIVRSTIDLGHNLGLEVVAEGVENNEVLERLRSFGCDVAQGFCISRPLPARHLMSWLATTVHTVRRNDPLDIGRLASGGQRTGVDDAVAPAGAPDDVEPLTD